jgi:hypothetical protein
VYIPVIAGTGERVLMFSVVHSNNLYGFELGLINE